jgi:ADP-ribosylglycohydrolase
LQRNPLLGQAIGDRIGGPIRMALMLGESISTCGGYDIEHVVSRYLAWYKSNAFDTGPIWEEVFALVDAGLPHGEAALLVHEASSGMTAGTNPAHRATVLGCASVISDDDLPYVARREARITHWHEQACEAAAATAVIVRSQLRGASISEAVRIRI